MADTAKLQMLIETHWDLGPAKLVALIRGTLPAVSNAEIVEAIDAALAARDAAIRAEKQETRNLELLCDAARMLGCAPDAPISSVLENLSAKDLERVDALVAARKAEWVFEDAGSPGQTTH